MITKCQVCEKHKTETSLPGGVIFKNALVFIAHFPLVEKEAAHKGHLILEMARHIITPSQMTDEEATEVGRWFPRLTRALEEAMGAEHVYVVRIGDKTPHLHFHFIPRFPGTPKEAWGPLINTTQNGGPKANAPEMVEITNKIRNFLTSYESALS